jgi:SAM-dependent methyltransferase
VEGVVAGPEPPCRLCGAPLRDTFADLGSSPLANAYPTAEERARGERFLPLRALVCRECFLVQLPALATPEEIFSEYAYFSSYSDTWVEHARRYVEEMLARGVVGAGSLVLEVASNDGYLLRFFRERGVEVLGVEPARNVAEAARAAGVPTLNEFFGAEVGRRLAAEGRDADLVVGNNVLAHVPDAHDFVEGLRAAVRPEGLVTLEFPHLLRLIEGSEFDTIYHEHFSYFALGTARRLLAEHGLDVVDVEELPTHGGSLRVHARPGGEAGARVDELLARERAAGLESLDTYRAFAEAVRRVQRELLAFVRSAKREGRSIAAYGAAAKGVTLLNSCGIGSDLVDYVVDRSPHKQGRFLPGTGIPIHEPARVRETRPDYLLILPWNLADEIMAQMRDVVGLGTRFVIPIPELRVVP